VLSRAHLLSCAHIPSPIAACQPSQIITASPLSAPAQPPPNVTTASTPRSGATAATASTLAALLMLLALLL
jgi:hypothetical protein